MVTTRPPKTIVKPTALGPVANTDTKLLIYGLFQKGRVLAQDGIRDPRRIAAGGICRVGMAGRPTTPLTEPDLWASHPALWNEFFMVKQRKLTRDQLHSV